MSGLANLQHVLMSQQFTPEIMRELLEAAELMRQVWHRGGNKTLLAGCFAVNIFSQPSTRTRTSFRTGQLMLGARIICDVDNPDRSLSLSKSESWSDTVSTFESMVPDPRKLAIIIRHPKPETAELMASASGGCHIINAGCGKEGGQHPTQALQDILTIYRHGVARKAITLDDIGKTDHRKPYKVMMVGDLRNGRTVRSLSYLISTCFPWVEIFYFSPPSLMMGADILEHLDQKGVQYHQSTDPAEFLSVITQVHCLCCTRFQFEDLDPADRERFDEFQRSFQVSLAVAQSMKEEAIIMHPWPRNQELLEEVDSDHRAVYHNVQMENGVINRMLLLFLLLNGDMEALRRAAA